MRLWSFCISADQTTSIREGFIRAPSAEAALEAIGHPEANVYELPLDVEANSAEILVARPQPSWFKRR